MTGKELLAALEQRNAVQSGHFILSSGRHSDRFIQKFRIFEDPPMAEAVGKALADLLRPYRADVVVSAAVGGILPGYIVAKYLGVRDIFIEKQADVPVLRRGFSLAAGERALIVEDVLTTGKSSAEVASVITAAGADVAAIGTIVRRGTVEFPYPLVAVLDLPLADYDADACPLCRRGIPLQDPGSRRIASLKR